MIKRIYVGNLPFNVSEQEIREMFEAHGPVESVDIISDRETGKPRGFGFVQMEDASVGDAIAALDGTSMGGRSLRVNEARPRRERGNGGGGGGGGGGGRGRGNRY